MTFFFFFIVLRLGLGYEPGTSLPGFFLALLGLFVFVGCAVSLVNQKACGIGCCHKPCKNVKVKNHWDDRFIEVITGDDRCKLFRDVVTGRILTEDEKYQILGGNKKEK
jgi:hypothetical protein